MEERIKVAGFPYHSGMSKLISGEIKSGDRVLLLHDPNNKYDENAIAIYHENEMIGFVPKKINEDILARFVEDDHCFGEVYDLSDVDTAIDAPWKACEIIVRKEEADAV